MNFQQALAEINGDLAGHGPTYPIGGLKEDFMQVLRPRGPQGQLEPAALVDVGIEGKTLLQIGAMILILDIIGDPIKRRIAKL